MKMHAGVYWSAGVGHEKNQDSLSLQQASLQRGECLLAVVCDGIGSLQAAEDAGGIVVSHLTDWFYHEGKELICHNRSKEKILLALQGQIFQIQESLQRFQQKEHIQTGTTCSGILLTKRNYYLIHIGDCRIYLIRRTKNPFLKKQYHMQCLTKDDQDKRGHLFKALGLAGSDRAVFEAGKLRRHTGFLICTDGFYRQQKKEVMEQMLGPLILNSDSRLKDQIERRLEMLGSLAAQQGSRDDMSAIGIIVR